MMQPVPLPLTGGVNLTSDPTELREGQWQVLQNIVPKPSGKYGQRPSLRATEDVIPSWWKWDSRTLTGSLGVASAVANYFQWARNLRPLKFIFDPNNGYLSMVCITTAAIAVIDQLDPTTRVSKTVPEGTMLLVTLPGIMSDDGTNPVLDCAVLGTGPRAPSLFAYNDRTYAFGGDNAGRYTAAPGGTVAGVAFSYWAVDFGATNSAFIPEGAAVVRDRVVYFIGSNVYWSDKNDPTNIGPDAVLTRGINLGSEEQEPIVAVSEISLTQTGSPTESACAVWTRNHMFLLAGEPGESDATTAADIIGTLQINKMNLKAGCVAPASITRTPFGMFWVGPDDIWFMPTGNSPIRVGTNLRPILRDQPPGVSSRIYAAYTNGTLRVGLFNEGSGPGTYSPVDSQYWLDLRIGPPQSPDDAAWFGPQVFVNQDCPEGNGHSGVYCVATDDRATGDGQLYALQSYFLPGDSDGTSIYGMSLCGLDSYGGRDITAPCYGLIPWSAGTAYSEGDVVVPPPNTGATFVSPVWVCSVAGTSGGSEPNWATNAATLADNTVTWRPRYWNGATTLTGTMPEQRLSAFGDTAVEVAVTSREVVGDSAVEKLLDGAELVLWIPYATQVAYNSNPDQDSRSRVITPTFIGTQNTVGSWGGVRNWQRKLLTQAPTKRFAALSATWNMRQDAGYVITAGVDDTLLIRVSNVPYTVTIAAGYYETIIDLASAVLEGIGRTVGSTNFESTYSADLGYGRSLVGFRELAAAVLRIYTTSRLAQLLGYNPTQNGGVGYVESAGFVYGMQSPPKALAAPIEFNSITLRMAQFGRRPV